MTTVHTAALARGALRSLDGASPARQRGFTLTEILMTVTIGVIMASLAYPAYQGQLARARRVDGIAGLLQLQQAEEKWRGEHSAYASRLDLPPGPVTPEAFYALDIDDASATGYVLVARASGRQTIDKSCAVLKLTVKGGQTILSSGIDDAALNADAANKRCWNS